MADRSRIEWTDATWNPVTGCTKVSPGCKHCYAERMAGRLQAMGAQKYQAGFRVTLHPGALTAPLAWRAPRRVFVNSMSDLFHQDVPDSFIQQVFGVMAQAPRHTFQVLTKRPERAEAMQATLVWPTNVWLGVSIETEDWLDRADRLRRISPARRFLSLEPLLGPLPSLTLDGIDWVIVGGESGPKARPMSADWVRAIRDACLREKVAFTFKQWGGRAKHLTGRTLDGRTWEQAPGQAGDR